MAGQCVFKGLSVNLNSGVSWINFLRSYYTLTLLSVNMRQHKRREGDFVLTITLGTLSQSVKITLGDNFIRFIVVK